MYKKLFYDIIDALSNYTIMTELYLKYHKINKYKKYYKKYYRI